MGWNNWSNTKKGGIIGLIVGGVLAIINTILAGIPGIIIFSFINKYLIKVVSCHGEDCWSPMAILSNIEILVLAVLIGLIIGKLKRK